jgi:hypothetical protein
MDLVTARRTIEALADGVDPRTGELLPPASPIESPDVIRALHFALAAIDRQTETRSKDGNLPPNAGKPWREDDDKLLGEHFDAGRSVAEISGVFQRTRGSIASRLVKLGKVPDRYSALHAGAQPAPPTEALAAGLAANE